VAQVVDEHKSHGHDLAFGQTIKDGRYQAQGQENQNDELCQSQAARPGEGAVGQTLRQGEDAQEPCGKLDDCL
jgi:hypothetical protein